MRVEGKHIWNRINLLHLCVACEAHHVRVVDGTVLRSSIANLDESDVVDMILFDLGPEHVHPVLWYLTLHLVSLYGQM